LTYIGSNTAKEKAAQEKAFEKLIRFGLTPDSAVYGLMYSPDRGDDVRVGSKWLKTVPTTSDVLARLKKEKDETRGTTFVVRSFLYLAYSEITGCLLVPDATRVPVINDMVAVERDIREKILETLQETWTGHVSAITERVSPFAAIVFERAEGDRRRIPQQMDLMRSDLATLRRRVRRAEQKLFFGKGDEIADAENTWRKANEEIKRSFGSEPHLVTVDGVLSLAKTGAATIDSPTKVKSWMSILLGLPVEVLRRVAARRPAVELHRLRPERTAPGRLAQSIKALFGLGEF
jgi:hypothetical protein